MTISESRSGQGARDAVHVAPTLGIPDSELAHRVAAGDSWAEEAVYRRYVAVVLGTARRLLANSAEAEDVAQETFATAFEIWDQLRDPARMKQWLLQIAVRKVHRRFRRRKLLRTLGFVDAIDDATLACLAGSSCSSEARAELALVDRVLNRIPTVERIAWMLRYVEGLSLDEVAYECDCSLATAKRRIAASQSRIDAVVKLEVENV